MEMVIKRKNVDYVVLFDDEDFNLINQYLWYIDQDGYVVGYRKDLPTTHKKWIKMHRLVMGDRLNGFPVTDHKDHNKLDNRKSQLRPALFSQNAMNRRKICTARTSLYKGVSFVKESGKWAVWVEVFHKSIGRFETEIEAAEAYDEAVKKYYGEFAYLNFK